MSPESDAEIRCALKCEAIVGESPLWDPAEQRLYWVDIQGKRIHRFDPVRGEDSRFELPDLVTSIALREKGGLVLTTRKGFAFFDPATSRLSPIVDIEADKPQNRFNDGKCDPQGRFWAGTMDEKEWQKPAGGLYRLDAALSPKKMQDDVICSNGTGWSPDGRTMYYTESFRYAVFAYDFEPESGEISGRRVFTEFDRGAGGFPDGLTVDAEGFVWSNVVGRGEIHRLDPRGKVERIIRLPVPRATACAFGGPGFGTLYITSARETMSLAALAGAPLSGSLFAVDWRETGSSIRGLAPGRFAG